MKILQKAGVITLALALILNSALAAWTDTKSSGDAILASDWNAMVQSTWDGSNGNVYRASGKVGIGTTDPNRSLQISDTSGPGYLQITSSTSGSTATDGLEFSIGTDASIWNYETGYLRFGTAGTERVRIDSTGNVGIGETVPQYKLSLASTGNSQIGVYGDATHYANIKFYDPTTADTVFDKYDASGGDYRFQVNGSDKFVILNNGNVGIGSAGPQYPLEIEKGSYTVPFIAGSPTGSFGFGGTNVKVAMGVDNTSEVYSGWIQAANESFAGYYYALSLNPNGGNVGIGTTAPGGKLDVFGSIFATDSSGGLNVAYIDNTGAMSRIGSSYKTGGSYTPLTFLAGGSERIRITTSGNVGIGTTAPTTALEVAGTIYSTTGGIKLPDGTVIDAAADLGTSSQWTTTGSDVYYSDGNVGIGTTTPGIETATGRNYLTIKGSTSSGVLELSTEEGDADGVVEGIVQFADRNSTSTDKRTSAIAGFLDGSTANDRGGSLVFLTKADGASGVAEKMRIDADGNVGIGTTAPDTTLHVMGVARFQGSTQFGQSILIKNTYPTTGNEWRLDSYGSTGNFQIYDATNSKATFAIEPNTPTNTMYLDSSGNVGIGTTAPTTALEVAGTIYSTTGGIKLPDGTVIDEASDMGVSQWTTSSSDIYYTTGNIGVGTTAPTERVTIAGATGIAGVDIIPSGWTLKHRFGALGTAGNVNYISSNYDPNADTVDYSSYGTAQISLAPGGSGSSINFSLGATNTAPSPKMTVDQNGNVGIGTTAPTDLLVLEKSGASLGLDLNSYGGTPSINLYGPEGTSATPAVNSAGDVLGQIDFKGYDTGESHAAQIIGEADANFGTSGDGTDSPGRLTFLTTPDGEGDPVERVRIDSSGNVGIGTTSPGAKLDVNGGIRILGSSIPTSGVGLELTGGANNYISAYDRNTSAYKPLYVRGSVMHLGSTNTADALFIQTDGKVGIGTTDPGMKLDVIGNMGVSLSGGSSHKIYLHNDASNGYLTSSNGVVIESGSSDRTYLRSGTGGIRINDNNANNILMALGGGNVGIGTTSPTYSLSLGGNANRAVWMERNTTANTAGNALTIQSGGAYSGGTDLAGGALALSSGTSTGTGTSAINFYTATAGTTGTADNAPTQKMTILGNGNVGIGTTSPSSKLDVNGEYSLNNGNSRIASSSSHLMIGTYSGGSSGYTDIWDWQNSVSRVRFENGGNVGIGTTAPTTALEVAGTIYSTTGGIKLPDGTVIDEASDMGVSQWTTTGSDVYYTTGNIGVGTTAPGDLLQVSTDTAGEGFTLYDDVSARNIAVIERGSSSNDPGVLHLYNAGSETVRLNGESSAVSFINSGNVGIGTTAPNEKLEVSGNLRLGQNAKITMANSIGSAADIITFNSDNFVRLGGTSTNGVIFQNGVASNITPYVDNTYTIGSSTKGYASVYSNNGYFNNSVGIGTTTAAAKLEVATAQNTTTTGEFTSPFIRLDPSSVTNTTGFTGISYGVSTLDNYGWTAGARRIQGDADVNAFVFSSHVNSAQGTERMRITSTGNVGIGTTTPDAKLHVAGEVVIDQDSKYGFYRNSDGTHIPGMSFNGTNLVNFGGSNVAYLTLSPNGSEGVRVNSTGMGIGTTAPTTALDVNGTVTATAFAGDGSALTGISTSKWSGSTDIYYTAGNVGIGTTAPADHLDIYGTGTQAMRVESSGGDALLRLKDGTANEWTVRTDYSDSSKFQIREGADPFLTINTSGNVGIGTTNPLSDLQIGSGFTFHSGGTKKINFNGYYDSATESDLRISDGPVAALGFDTSGNIKFWTDATGTAGTEYVNYTRMMIANDGNVGINTTSPVAKLDINGGVAFNIVTKTADYTATVNDYMILCDATAAAVTITLPAAASSTGLSLTVKKIDSSANACTIDGNLAETIDDAATKSTATQYKSYTLISDGTEWWIQ